MNPHHHLDDATLVAYAAAGLPAALTVVVAAHLSCCRQCRERLAFAETVGGCLLEQQETMTVAAMPESVRQRLGTARTGSVSGRASAPAARPPAGTCLPAPLWPYFGETYEGLRWRLVAPGIHRVRAGNVDDGQLFMLRIAAGKQLPMHGHGGSELTLVLRGAYDDALGHWAAGDIADLDVETEHQPVTSPGGPCICVAALDAPLRFRGWLARRLQPLVGM
jgi:putative transcriptional regulator